MQKRLTFLLAAVWAALLLSAATPASAQGVRNGVNIPLAVDYDLDSGTYVYPVTKGLLNFVQEAPKIGRYRVKTVGSSTTVTSLTSGVGAFDGVAVSDVIIFTIDGIQTFRQVTAKASSQSLTVNSAIDLSATGGYGFTYRTFDAAGAGWVPVNGVRNMIFQLQATQMNAASIDIIVECKLDGIATTGVEVFGPTLNGATATVKANQTTTFNIAVAIKDQPWDFCRAGFKINTDDGVDTGAAAEKIQSSFEGVRQ